MELCLPKDPIYGPNDCFHLPTYFKAIETSIYFLDEVGKRLRSKSARSRQAHSEKRYDY
jgi:hypothetical protein